MLAPHIKNIRALMMKLTDPYITWRNEYNIYLAGSNFINLFSRTVHFSLSLLRWFCQQ